MEISENQFNDNKKRLRPDYFQSQNQEDSTLFDIFTNSTIQDMGPFYNTLSTLPGYNSHNISQNSLIIKDEEAKKKFRKEQYERSKEEIRQIMRLNKINKNKAINQEKKLKVFVVKNNPNVFVTGRPLRRKRNNKKFY